MASSINRDVEKRPVLIAMGVVAMSTLVQCSPERRGPLKPKIEIQGVGTLQLGGDRQSGYHRYGQWRSNETGGEVEVLVYPDHDALGAAYEERVRTTVERVIGHQRGILMKASDQVLALASEYGGSDMQISEIVDGLQLTHLKIYRRDRIDLIFSSESFFPHFDMNAALDDDANIVDVWFDG